MEAMKIEPIPPEKETKSNDLNGVSDTTDAEQSAVNGDTVKSVVLNVDKSSASTETAPAKENGCNGTGDDIDELMSAATTVVQSSTEEIKTGDEPDVEKMATDADPLESHDEISSPKESPVGTDEKSKENDETSGEVEDMDISHCPDKDKEEPVSSDITMTPVESTESMSSKTDDESETVGVTMTPVESNETATSKTGEESENMGVTKMPVESNRTATSKTDEESEDADVAMAPVDSMEATPSTTAKDDKDAIKSELDVSPTSSKTPPPKSKKRKTPIPESPSRIQPRRTAAANINFKEPTATEGILPSKKTPAKVTVIELGSNSNNKISDIMSKNSGGQTKIYGNSSITISSTKVPASAQASLKGQAVSIMKSRLKSQNAGDEQKPRMSVADILRTKGSSQPVNMASANAQRASVADLLKNKGSSQPPVAPSKSPEIIYVPSEPVHKIDDDPNEVVIIDEKAEYDKMKWELDYMYPHIRPGRYVPPSPNETMSLSMCSERLIECASKVTPFVLRYPIIPKVDGYKFKKLYQHDKQPTSTSANYFGSSLGNFFMEIGQRLVSEWVQKDLVRSRKRKMEKEGQTEASVKSLEAMTTMYEQLKSMNSVFHYPMKRCQRCPFVTESSVIMENHLETPHVFPGTYKYSCTRCDFDTRDISTILVHMRMYHAVAAKVEPIPLFHQCPLCLYNSDKKHRMYAHVSKCTKSFKMAFNLSPTADYSFPAKSFNPTWMHSQNFVFTKPAKASIKSKAVQGNRSIQPIRTQPASNHVGGAQGPVIVHDLKTKLFKLLNTSDVANSPSAVAKQSSLPARQANVSNSPITIIKNAQAQKGPVTPKSIQAQNKPSITLTPVNNTPESKAPTKATINGLQSITVPYKGGKGSHTFVICEICDGYIRDLEQLRAHMQWMHKVKIHPKMIHNRPPLNCQKCKFRFFTDQGLERHLLGIHGLVTSNMQESANKGEDSGRCSSCGKLFQSKLLYHIAKVHKIPLKPAHLSYKCTVCTATFTLYKLFEAHVYSKHKMQTTPSAPDKKDIGKLAPKNIDPSSRPGPLCSKKRLATDSAATPEPVAKTARVLPQCPECDKTVFNLERHWSDFHQKKFSIKLCHIEQCHKCLSEFNGFVVIHTDYFDSDSDQE